MLKKPLFSPAQPRRAETRLFPCVALASFRSSTYPWRVRFRSSLAAALLTVFLSILLANILRLTLATVENETHVEDADEIGARTGDSCYVGDKSSSDRYICRSYVFFEISHGHFCAMDAPV